MTKANGFWRKKMRPKKIGRIFIAEGNYNYSLPTSQLIETPRTSAIATSS